MQYLKTKIIGSTTCTELLCAVMYRHTSETKNEYIQMTELINREEDPWVHAVVLGGGTQRPIDVRLTPTSITRRLAPAGVFYEVFTENWRHVLHRSCRLRINGEDVSLSEWYNKKSQNMTSVVATHYLRRTQELVEKSVGVRALPDVLGMVEMEVDSSPHYNNQIGFKTWCMLRDGLLIRL